MNLNIIRILLSFFVGFSLNIFINSLRTKIKCQKEFECKYEERFKEKLYKNTELYKLVEGMIDRMYGEDEGEK